MKKTVTVVAVLAAVTMAGCEHEDNPADHGQRGKVTTYPGCQKHHGIALNQGIDTEGDKPFSYTDGPVTLEPHNEDGPTVFACKDGAIVVVKN